MYQNIPQTTKGISNTITLPLPFSIVIMYHEIQSQSIKAHGLGIQPYGELIQSLFRLSMFYFI